MMLVMTLRQRCMVMVVRVSEKTVQLAIGRKGRQLEHREHQSQRNKFASHQ